ALVEPLVDRHTAQPQNKSPPRRRPSLDVQGVHGGIGRSAGRPDEPESKPAKHTHRELGNSQIALLSSGAHGCDDRLRVSLVSPPEQRQPSLTVAQSKLGRLYLAFADHHHSEYPVVGHAEPQP